MVAEIETLVNALMRRGTRRANLVARIAGGAHTLGRGRNVGGQIAEVCLDYLLVEGIPLAEESLGGTLARRVLFQPTTGVMTVSFPGATQIADFPSEAEPGGVTGADVEIF